MEVRTFRVVLIVIVTLAMTTVATNALYPGAAQRALVGYGIPLPGWCTLQLDEDTVQVLNIDQAKDLLTRAVGGQASEQEFTALTTPSTFTCTTERNDLEEQQPNPSGLTPRAQELKTAVRETFGEIINGGYDPQGITDGRVNRSAHYDGRAIDYFFRPYDEPAKKREGWLLTHWLVAHSKDLNVATLIYDDRIWSTRRSGQGWRGYVHPSGDRENPVLRHLDHVHVDVVRGRSVS